MVIGGSRTDGPDEIFNVTQTNLQYSNDIVLLRCSHDIVLRSSRCCDNFQLFLDRDLENVLIADGDDRCSQLGKVTQFALQRRAVEQWRRAVHASARGVAAADELKVESQRRLASVHNTRRVLAAALMTWRSAAVEAHQHRLSSAGKQLKDNTQNETIHHLPDHLVMRLRGGGDRECSGSPQKRKHQFRQRSTCSSAGSSNAAESSSMMVARMPRTAPVKCPASHPLSSETATSGSGVCTKSVHATCRQWHRERCGALLYLQHVSNRL